MTKTAEMVVEELRQKLVEDKTITAAEARELTKMTTLTLGDLVLEGSQNTTQAFNWGSGETACALSAAGLALQARGYSA